jgi:ABC-type transporter Mla MlaB component
MTGRCGSTPAALTRLDSAGVMMLVNRLRAMGVVWSNVSLHHFNPPSSP